MTDFVFKLRRFRPDEAASIRPPVARGLVKQDASLLA